MDRNREKIIQLFADDIESVAQLRLKQITPRSLTRQGDYAGASQLSFLIARLDDNLLLGEVDKRVEKLRQQEEKQQTGGEALPPPEPTRHVGKKQLPPLHPQQTEVYSQPDLFASNNPESTTQQQSEQNTDFWRDPEGKLAQAHAAFNSKNGTARNKILAPDAERDAREFYNKLELPTWTEKRQTLLENYYLYKTFLQDVGLFDTIWDFGITYDVHMKLQEVLKNLNSNMYDYDAAGTRIIRRFLNIVLTIKPRSR